MARNKPGGDSAAQLLFRACQTKPNRAGNVSHDHGLMAGTPYGKVRQLLTLTAGDKRQPIAYATYGR